MMVTGNRFDAQGVSSSLSSVAFRPSRRGLSRRTVLAGAGAAAIAAGFSVLPTPRVRAQVTEDRRRVVVIGSGFGGGVAAARLARAGVETLVLERGLRWRTGPNAETFSHVMTPDKRSTFLADTTAAGVPATFEKFPGILERVRGEGMDIMCAAGVGGGSLNYHGMTLQPTEANFTRDIPGVDYAPMRDIYYRRVAQVLRPAPLPDDLWNSPSYQGTRLFAEMVGAAGLEHFRVPLPIDWEFARMELRGQAKPSYTNSDLSYGVNNGGKRTVDVTYVKAAEGTGRVTVETLHIVRDVERRADGRWLLHTDRIDTTGAVVERKQIMADAVFLAAGSAGTTRLLCKAKAKNLIGDLPDATGQGWGSNGDRIYLVRAPHGSWGAQQGGPACVGVKFWDDPAGPFTIAIGPAPFPVDLDLMSMVGFGSVEPKGEFVFDPALDDAILHWKPDYSADLTSRIRATIGRIVGPDPGGAVIDTGVTDTSTWHPLGGAVMGAVCDTYGRVSGQRGLYVVDGALIPGNTGACNPSMTIAALAERCLDDILAKDLGTVF